VKARQVLFYPDVIQVDTFRLFQSLERSLNPPFRTRYRFNNNLEDKVRFYENSSTSDLLIINFEEFGYHSFVKVFILLDFVAELILLDLKSGTNILFSNFLDKELELICLALFNYLTITNL